MSFRSVRARLIELQRIRCDEVSAGAGDDAHRTDEFDALAESIRLHGVLRPVLVRPTSNGYLIVHGERRWRAARMVGLKEIPALIVQDISSRESASTDCGAPHPSWFQPDCRMTMATASLGFAVADD